MANIETQHIESAIQESQELRRASLTQILLQYRTLLESNHEIDMDSDEGEQIMLLAGGALSALDIQTATQVLRAGVQQRISTLRQDVELHDRPLREIRGAIDSQITVLNLDGRHSGIEGIVLSTLGRVQDIMNDEDITPDTIMKYEIYIGMRRYRQIDRSTGLIEQPISEGSPNEYGRNRMQAIFDSMPNVPWADWYDLEATYEGITKVLPFVDDYTPYEEGVNSDGEPGREPTVTESYSLFSLVDELIEIDEYDDNIVPLLNKIDIAIRDFTLVLPTLDSVDVQPKTHAITPNLIAGQESTWSGSPLDRLEDFLSRNTYNSIGVEGAKLLELEQLPETNFDPRTISSIARIGKGINFDAQSVFEAQNIDSFFSEMRDGVDGRDISNVTEEQFIDMLLPYHGMNIFSIAKPLQDELVLLDEWEPGQTWDPFMRVVKGVDASGDPIGYQNYGPYTSPKEKAIAITSYLLMLDGVEEDGRMIISFIYDNFITNLPDYIFGFEGITLLQLYVTERYLSTLLRGVNGVRGLRVNAGSAMGRVLSRIPFVPNGETTAQEESQERRLTRRKGEIEEMQSILRDLGINDERISLLGEFLDEDARGFMNHSTMFSRNLFYSDVFGIINDKNYGFLSLTRSRAHYRLMEFFNVNVQSSLAIGDPNGVMPFTGDYEARQVFGRTVPLTGDINIHPKIPLIGGATLQNRLLGTRVEGTGSNMPHLDPREAYRFSQDALWAESPLSHHNRSVAPQRKVQDIIERYGVVNEIFGDLSNFEKFRPDVVDDSDLGTLEGEIEEMRKQFIQGNQVELDSSGDAVRDTDGKLVFESASGRPAGDTIDDFKKLVNDWTIRANPEFNIEYGKALEANRLQEADSQIHKDRLESARTYANSLSNDTHKQAMLQQINWLEGKLDQSTTVVSGIADDDGVDTRVYREYLTETEFYQRLTGILDQDAGFDQKLGITNLTDFRTAKADVESALSGSNGAHPLARIWSNDIIQEQTRRRFDWFNQDGTVNEQSRAYQLFERAKIQAEISNSRSMIAALNALEANPENIRGLNLELFSDFTTHLETIGVNVERISNLTKAELERQLTEAQGRRFDPRNLSNSETNEGQMLRRAELYALSVGDEGLLRDLGSIRRVISTNPTTSRPRTIRTMAAFERILTQELNIPDDVDFSRSMSVFQSDAMRNIVTIGESRIYIENLQAGENSVIQEKIREEQARQRALVSKELMEAIDGHSAILGTVLDELNIDGRGRQITTRGIITDAIRNVF